MANIAIFRINYKSDFILTLNSDAGWMTPFCIKFWTGAPSQAYFVGFDGTTYTHCVPVAGEPTKLLVQFDDHHLPIGDLKFQIAYHFTVADFPNDTEDEVINPSNITTEIDGETYQVMLDFTGETAPEIEFSLPAYANEAQRIANEQQRIANEQTRIENEQTRISNEQTRVAHEQTRQQNEAQRIAQESARVSEFASLKSASESATRDANNAATLANEKAQLADDKAALADGAATQASLNAVYAHDEGQLAGQKAIEAAQATQLATNEAAFAHDQGTYAKNQGDYAKAQGDTALADHVRANADHSTAVDDHTKSSNDHTRAESDHSTSAADHTTAGNDHTLAESDHGIAADDHTQAGNDHTRAESDHGIASDDHTQAGNDHTRAESDHTRAESDHAAVEVYVDSLGAFDISAYHATGGVLAEYADLTAALGTNGANIPDALRKGGMSIKFIQGTVQNSDNKYVQYFLTKDEWSANEAYWQKMNLEEEVWKSDLLGEQIWGINYVPVINKVALQSTGWNVGNNQAGIVLKVVGRENFKIKRGTDNIYIAFLKSFTIPIASPDPIDYCENYNSPIYISGTNIFEYTLPSDCRYVFISIKVNSVRTPSVISINGIDVLNGISKNLEEINTSISTIESNVSNLSENKIDKNSINVVDWDNITLTAGKYYKRSTGALVSGGDYSAAPLIPVLGNTIYYLSCLRNNVESAIGNVAADVGICFYTDNNVSTFISNSGIASDTKQFTTPATAKYIGISIYLNSQISEPCLQIGTSRNYQPYNFITGYLAGVVLTPSDDTVSSDKIQKNAVTAEKLANNSVTSEKILDGEVVEDKTPFFERTRNLFDYTKSVSGKYVKANGDLGDSELLSASDYIPVDPSKGYITSNYYGTGGSNNAFYDSSKVFIPSSNFQSMPIAIPNNAAYMRITVRIENLQQCQVEYGTESTAYIPYGYLLKKKYVDYEEEVVEKQKLSLPKKLYILQGVNNDIFYDAILRYWNPYKYDVKSSVADVRELKRVVTLNNPAQNQITFSVYDDEKESYIINKTFSIIKGVPNIGNTTIKVGIIGDSYTYGGCFTPALLDNHDGNPYVPNLQLVGTYPVAGHSTQYTDGRPGWTLGDFCGIVTEVYQHNPYYHPSGNHRYWGVTAFWADVCGGSPTTYGVKYARYASLCDSNGYPISPVEGDIIYDSTEAKFKEYQSGAWIVVASTVNEVKQLYTWGFDYGKYLSMWDIETADMLCVYLGVNDVWVRNEPTEAFLNNWMEQMDSIIESYLSVNPAGKLVILCPNTVTHPNTAKYKPLDVHRRMWTLRDAIITNYDERESESIYVVDTAHLIDSENAFVLWETAPYDGYPSGYKYMPDNTTLLNEKTVYVDDGQHPRVNYSTLGYSLAAFIQYNR